MLKKTISYTDYDGNQRTEDFYFNLSKAEITEMELSMEGGMRAYIKRIIAAKSQLELVKLFKDVVLKSYGKKSADGRLFMKNVEPEPGYEDGRNSKRCACTERGIGTGLSNPLTVTVRLREAMTELSRRASFV